MSELTINGYVYSIRPKRDVSGKPCGWYLRRTSVYGGNTEIIDIFPSRSAARKYRDEMPQNAKR